jgi:pimeloyl-ACP methyl ester carboxylesterase
MAALWLAIDEPRLASRVAILGLPGSVLPGSRPDLALALLSIPGLNRLLLSLPSSPKRSRSLLKLPLGRAALAKTPQEMFEVHHLASRRPEFALTLSTFMETTLRWRSPRPGIVLSDSEIRGLRQHVRFIWGDGDIYGAPEIGDSAARLMQHATITVHPGGHFPQLDDPEGCGRCISELLTVEPLA